GQSNSSFDWTVIAKVLPPEAVVASHADVALPSGGQIEQAETAVTPAVDVDTSVINTTTTPVVIPTVMEESLTPTTTEAVEPVASTSTEEGVTP
ncbi:MAG: hypothetical protein AAB797_03140, partial [Patescibacteria group bacterium]